MKKLTRKLLLSVFTLAICAVTLVSTTFAWYTTNTEAVVNGVTGTTSQASADSSILIAKATNASTPGSNLEWSTYSSSVSILADNYRNNGSSMVPLGINGDYLTNQETSVTNTTAQVHYGSDGGAYICIPLKFKTGKTDGKVEIYLSQLSISNNGPQLTPFDGIVTAGDITQGTRYTVDAAYAVNMIVSDSDSKLTNPMVFDLGTQVKQDQISFNEDINNVAGDKVAYSLTSGAHAYYNAIMETNKDITSVPEDTRYVFATDNNPTTATKIAEITCSTNTDNNVVVKYFYFYLDGWDNGCYDACRGQSFNISLSFTTDASKALDAAQRTTVPADPQN